ncbi:RelA/SpoT domain-containing protein [Massilia sp. DWR3-1-1]|uniref:RelA/SpoT domain-containing protein n=1 Tax=Massilia sp. DWR3-1-1 TaxID=2804559 RepID=UPI003CE9080F
MSYYAKPNYPRAKVNEAGRKLAGLESDDGKNYLMIIDNWRAAHAHPLNAFYMTLKRRATKFARTALVVQRIKRLESIAFKLIHSNKMKLTQMQDIAGCRAVLPSVDNVRKLQRYYQTEPLAHTYNGCKDYIDEPKETGYRGIHLKYSIASVNAEWPYNGLKIEIQLRTLLQHKWATAVEAAETFTGQALKSNQGSQDWRRFFSLMSSVFAIRENSPTVPGTPNNIAELHAEIRRLDKEHHMAATFSGYRAIFPQVEKLKDAKYFLVRLDPINRLVRVKGFKQRESQEANRLYTEAENEIDKKSAVRVVLVSVSSIASLRRAYPNYFLDTDAFLSEVNSIVGN